MTKENKTNRLIDQGIKIDLKVIKPGTIYQYTIYDEYGNAVLKANSPVTQEFINSCLEKNIRFLYYSKSFENGKNPAGLNLTNNAISAETQEEVKAVSRSLLNEIVEKITYSQEVTISRKSIMNITDTVATVIDEITQNDDAVLVTLRELKMKDEYTFLHSANVSMLASSVSVKLGYSKDKSIEMGVAGLLHDVGKSLIGYEIVHKATPLNPKEKALLMDHPKYGFKLAEQNRYITPLQKNTILLHHERPDGKGYPFSFDMENYFQRVSKEVRLISLCDVFSALTTERAYKPKYTPKRALRMMQNNVYADYKKNFQFVYDDFRDFIRAIGFMINMGDYIFNENEIIRLNTGEVARILELKKKSSLNPIIKLVTDKKLQPQKREVIIDMEKDITTYISAIIDKTTQDEHLLSLAH